MKLLYTLTLTLILSTAYSQTFLSIDKLIAPDRGPGDQFSNAVEISGNYAIIGAAYEDEDTAGLNTLSNAGAAYIFERDINGNWNAVQKLIASDRAANDWFGNSVDISEDYAIIGAMWEDEDASGSNTLTIAGSAYIFKRDSTGVWLEAQKIVASDRGTHDQFGYSVAISGGRAVVGARFEDEDTAGNNTLTDAGSVYVFELDSNTGNWIEIQKLTASDRGSEDQFGEAVGISGNHILVGAPEEDEDSSGLNTLSNSGSAYLFERSSGVWTQIAKLTAADRGFGDQFGIDVSISGDYAVVGSIFDTKDSSGTPISGGGSAYIFEKQLTSNWVQADKIIASDGDVADLFGGSVDVHGTRIIVGAHHDEHDLNGTNLMTFAGSAYIFQRSSSGDWPEIQKLVAYDRDGNDRYGFSVAIGNSAAIVGAYFEDEDELGNNTFTNAGSAYIYAPCFTSNSTIQDTACGMYVSPSNAHIWTASGTYIDTIQNAAGCDSIVTINLTILPVSYDSMQVATCNAYTSPSGNYVWTSSGTYNDTLVNTAGCDSIITIFLTNNTSYDTIHVTMCDSFVSPSSNYIWSISGTYTDTLVNHLGCDSIITIQLDIIHSSASNMSVSTCDPYQSPSGTYVWTTSGTYMDTLINNVGCDSIITFNLTILENSSGVLNTSACEDYTSPSGNYIWTSTGTYIDTLVNAAGCDSILTVNLTIVSIDTSVNQVGITLSANATGVDYQWLDCDNNYAIITGATGQSYTPLANGTYAVEVQDNNCIDTSLCYMIFDVSVPEHTLNGIKVFPNPTKGIVNIEPDRKNETYFISIYNSIGGIVYMDRIYIQDRFQFDLNVEDGCYFIELVSPNGERHTGKIWKKAH